MIPNITRGRALTGVRAYLVGPGDANEHERPTLIAASLGIAAEAGRARADARRDGCPVSNLMEEAAA